jgi:phage baseplate assembly protein W
MHKRTLLTALATAAAVAIATPSISQAQDTTMKTSKGEVALKPNFGSLISAINSSSAQSEKLKAMTEVTAANVQLVNVEDLIKGENVEALQNALKKNEADLSTLRTTLGANTSLSGVLTANATPLTATDVVATDVGPDGKVIVYFWKKPA